MLTYNKIKLTLMTKGELLMTITTKKIDWGSFVQKALNGERITIEEGLQILEAPEDQMLPMLNAAFQVRHHFFSKKVKLNMIFNAKSGACQEDCGYCSQSKVSDAPVKTYSLLDKETLIAGAKEALARKASTYCIVTSGRSPSEKEINEIVEAVREISETLPLKICTSLGILNEARARQLKEAGVARYNHNLNTHEDNYKNITSSHTYDDRVLTVESIKSIGISPCSGCIVGLGETDEQIVEMAYALHDLDADSIPVNFLHPVEGTPLGNYESPKPYKALKVLALMRFINPSKEIRISGGREKSLRHLQPLALYAANSIFVGDYLTTAGQEVNKDYEMIEDLGFEIE